MTVGSNSYTDFEYPWSCNTGSNSSTQHVNEKLKFLDFSSNPGSLEGR